MDFSLTAEQREIQALAREFADAEIVPHAAVWDPVTKLVLFDGGATAAQHALEGVWSFDPLKKKWNELAVKGEGPGPRAYHAAVLVPDGSLWVFGGTENRFNDPLRSAEAWAAKIRK